MRRVRSKVVAKLKQFGSLWVETIEVVDPDAGQTRRYDFMYLMHRRILGRRELRLARIEEQPREPR